MKKTVCQLCYKMNNIEWGEDEELEWSQKVVNCPCNLVPVAYKGQMIPKDNPLSTLMGTIFGTGQDINKSAPYWCPYAQEHSHALN